MDDFIPAAASVSIGRAFCQNGFVPLPQVFTRAEIEGFRRAAIDLLPANALPFKAQFSNAALFHEAFRGIFRNQRLLSALRELLGDDFVFVNEFALHDSYFSGWHSDTSSPEAKGHHEFHWSPRFMLMNVAIYLQDNRDNGGGLDAVPKSFLRDDPLALSLRGIQVAEPYKDGATIRSNAGDVVVFHLRTSHRSSDATREAQSDAERKLALFMIVGPNNELTRSYRTWIDEYDRMNGSSRATVPDEFRSFLSDNGLRII